MKLYPVFLKLAGERVVVVGAGPVAASKLDALVGAGAVITVVAPEITAEIRDRTDVTIIERAFADTDLDGARWVVAAAPPAINRAVATAAVARGLFVNAVDDTHSASAFLGGVVQRGDVTVAISTRGLAPALAGLLREAIDAVLPAELDRWIEVAKAARLEWKRDHIPMTERRPLLLRALVALYEARETTTAEHRKPFLRGALDRLGGFA